MKAIEYALKVVGWLYLLMSILAFIVSVLTGDREALTAMSRGIFMGFTLLGIAEVINRLDEGGRE